jgi:tetratricopeptide (TPR) repeat protein
LAETLSADVPEPDRRRAYDKLVQGWQPLSGRRAIEEGHLYWQDVTTDMYERFSNMLDGKHPLQIHAMRLRSRCVGYSDVRQSKLRLAIHEANALLGDRHPDAQYPRLELAAVYVGSKRYLEAMELYQHALSVLSDKFDEDSLLVADIRMSIARQLRLGPSYSEAHMKAANEHYRRALPVVKREHGEDAEETREARRGAKSTMPARRKRVLNAL